MLEGQRELPATISATPSVPNLAHHQDARAEAGAVPPVGLEPTTFGLKVRRPVIVWIEYIGVLATHWLTMRATVSRQSLPHQLAQLAYHDPTAARLPLD